LTQEQFVNALKIQVHDAAIRATLETLSEGPSGRRPPARLLALSEWFRSVRPEDRARIHEIVGLAVHGAIFRFLCLLDGASVLDDAGRTRPELSSVADGSRTILNDEVSEMLHDTYQSATYEEVFGRAGT
jgi:hypothetical protein